MRKIYLLCIASFLLSIQSFSQSLYKILPSETDAAIDTANYYHYVYINNTIPLKNKLVVFFPGTGGTPQAYTLFLATAANAGFHTIGLSYPNDTAINDLCALTADTSCHEKARLEIFDGTDRSALVTVNRTNSIEHRLIKLLQYLSVNYPDDNWQQFLGADDSTILWNKIIVAGHSQGGGQAAIISKYFTVDRVLMFSWTDWLFLFNKIAPWIKTDGATDKNAYYGFYHIDDELINVDKIDSAWMALHMFDFGSKINVDVNTSPYENSHTLITDAIPNLLPGQFHNCVAVSVFTPVDTNGNPLFVPVWKYMLGADSVSVVINPPPGKFKIYPDPAFNILFIIGNQFENAPYKIISLDGKILQWGLLNNSIDISSLQTGLYIIEVSSRGYFYREKFMKQ